MCPIVPMFTCGFDRSNFSLPMTLSVFPISKIQLPKLPCLATSAYLSLPSLPCTLAMISSETERGASSYCLNCME